MIRLFSTHKVLSCMLAMALCLTTTNFACNSSPAQWLNTIGEYLPVAIQIAQSIISLIGVFAPASAPDDQAAVRRIGDEATKDLKLLQTLYDQYKASPSPDTKAAIETALADITTNLPALLEAAHIKNEALLQRVTASVNIIMTVADIIIAQIPVDNPQLKARKAQKKATPPLSPKAVKAEWDAKVCGGDTACTSLVK